MSNLIRINGVELTPIEYRGARVMTLAMMDAAHQRPDGTARRTFNEHKARLIEGEDFMELTANEIRTQSLSDAFAARTGKAMLLTETGYSMLVKSFTDDLAWEVQRQLVRSYFKPAPAKPALPDFADPVAAARAWADAKDAERLASTKANQLEHQVAELAPAAAGLDRIANTDETMCMTDAAKTLQLAPGKFRDLLLEKKWIYPRQGKSGHVAYQDKIHTGYLKHKYFHFVDPESGEPRSKSQVLVTNKGVAKLATMLSKPMNESGARPTD